MPRDILAFHMLLFRSNCSCVVQFLPHCFPKDVYAYPGATFHRFPRPAFLIFALISSCSLYGAYYDSFHPKARGVVIVDIQIDFIRNALLGYFSETARQNASHNVLDPLHSPVENSSTTGHAVGVIRVIIQTANIKKTFLRTPRPFVRVGLRSDPKLHRRTSLLKERT